MGLLRSAEGQLKRNELYACGLIDRRPTVERMFNGFPARLAQLKTVVGRTQEMEAAFKQFKTVAFMHRLNEQRNGQQFFNLFQASAKLNEQLMLLEAQARYLGNCQTCAHGAHGAGMCPMCHCGLTEVIGGY